MPKNLSKETKNKEYFLVCVDESNEFQSALEYACINAQKQKINLLYKESSCLLLERKPWIRFKSWTFKIFFK